MTRAPSRILAPNGQPASAYLYASPRGNYRNFKPRSLPTGKMRQDITSYDRRELVDYSRQIRAQVDVLDTAIEQKNNWAFGDAWEPHYFGDEEAWGEEAEEFLNHQFFPTCNVRGPVFNLTTSLKLSGAAMDAEGDDVMVLTESESHFPQLAFFPGTAIGSDTLWSGKANDVKSGEFDGAKIFDGIITNRHNRIVGVRILQDDGKHQDISTYNCDFAFEPKWSDQVRGIPRIAVSLLRWMNLQDIDDFIQKGVKRAASVGLLVQNEEGEAAVGNEVITAEASPTEPDGDRQLHYEETAGGEAYYFKAGTGEGISAFEFKNPHPNTEEFIRRIQRGGLASVGWHYELLCLGDTGRAATRLLADLANMSIWDRQKSGSRRWTRAVIYALAKAAKHGFIRKPRNPMSYAMFEPGLPQEVTVDSGNEKQADREALKLGLTTRGIISAKEGRYGKQVIKERLKEIKQNVTDALEIVTHSGGNIKFEQAMELIEQRSPNPVAMTQQQPEAKKDE